MLFEGLNFGLNYGDKVALVANNGSGKTSMLKIIAGKDVPGTGKVTVRNGIRIGYLEQEPVFNEKLTVNELLYSSNVEVVRIIREYESALEMQTNDYNDTTAERFENCSVNMEKVDGWNFDNKLKQILSKFKIVDLEAKVEMLSCSSSIIKSPKSLKTTSFPINLWVPIKISTFPFFKPSKVVLVFFEDLKRLI